MDSTLVESAEDVSHIAFGFMASKALFAALHIDVFTKLAGGAKSSMEIAEEAGIPINRVTTLMTALTSVGLVDRDDEGEIYSNSPGAEAFLAKGAKYEFGDYLRYQIDQQMYPLLGQLNEVLDGTLDPDSIDSYQHWMADPEQASIYCEAQHAGSLGPGRTLARLVDLSDADTLLDVGGGTGAMSIRLLEAYPKLISTIIDFPNVAEIGWQFIAKAGMVDRIRYIPSNALVAEWPKQQGAILMSYLFSGIPGAEVSRLVDYAFECLAPGGSFMVHDFMVENDRTGPPMAALWQLQHMAFTPEARSVTPGWLRTRLNEAGFVDIQEDEMIPGLTRLIHARKPD
ncbi:MAG: ubiquinone/menaquinone biosynthesis C-methylase UbiE [Paracoccaceae bacterium]|jgi:ubiquinone/menaquinone biosynthesis C-methylase UbiE